MDAAVSTLTALAVFQSSVEHAAFRSVHGYRVVGRKGSGWVRWERWVERQFVLSLSACLEVALPASAPRILLAGCRGRPVFRQGQTVGTWRCIVAFDSVAAVAPSSPPPPVLSPLVNPRLQYLPNLYNDLQKVFPFQQREKKVRQHVNTKEKPIHSGEQEKTSDQAGSESDSDSDVDSQSDKDSDACEDSNWFSVIDIICGFSILLSSSAELAPPVQKKPRANRKHIDSITLVEIAKCFHLPIREASETLKIGVSILKRKCRRYGIPRWPHRKFKSLDSLIYDLEYVLTREDTQPEEQQLEEERLAAAIKALTKRKNMLESEKETLQQKPALDLMTETKLFREDVFKRRYKAKVQTAVRD
ncbi:hypothetical protein U9M48_033479 [Paspalum notatum var. saurae]|uniref:RWP-RK domain-containing protein n=1 Tax=Paspalum notatum var. saurae TaxID=547442 RepID=A0AAQ3X610_PASNO